MTGVPWADPALVNAAVELVCDVRDLDPADIIDQIQRIPPDVLAGLAVVLAAMCDPDAPMSVLHRWRADDFVGHREPIPPYCKRGHPWTWANTRMEGGTKRRCRTCDRERVQAARGKAS